MHKYLSDLDSGSHLFALVLCGSCPGGYKVTSSGFEWQFLNVSESLIIMQTEFERLLSN